MKKNATRPIDRGGWLKGYLYLLPFLLSVGIFTVYPIVNVFITSFKHNYNALTGAFSGVGLDNYAAVVMDPYFRSALRNTVVYVACVVPVSTVLAVFFANLLNKKLRLNGLFQTAYFLPLVTSTTAVGLAWKWMYHADYGVINYLLSLFGIEKLGWLTDVRWGMAALVIYGVWSILPFTIIIVLSGMQGIDEKLKTAARVDGASSRRIFFRITLPLLMPTVGLVVIINIINTFKVFAELFPLFKGEPGVAYTLFTVVYYIYNMFYSKWHFERACAAAVLLLIVMVLFTRIRSFIEKKWNYTELHLLQGQRIGHGDGQEHAEDGPRHRRKDGHPIGPENLRVPQHHLIGLYGEVLGDNRKTVYSKIGFRLKAAPQNDGKGKEAVDAEQRGYGVYHHLEHLLAAGLFDGGSLNSCFSHIISFLLL